MKTVNFILATVLLVSCQEAVKKESKAKEDPSSLSVSIQNSMEPRNVSNNTSIQNINDIIGYWVGEFEPDYSQKSIDDLMSQDPSPWRFYKFINVSIDSISGNHIFGHSLVSGLRRPLFGTYIQEGLKYVFNLSEPGDNQFDGRFEFSISENDSEIVGNWTANKKVKVFSRTYKLRKIIFNYQANVELESRFIDGNKTKESKIMEGDEEYIEESYLSTTPKVFELNSSMVELKAEDIENLSKADIFILRNSIYARHGYSFKNAQLAGYFHEQSWYYPVKSDIKKELSIIEKNNIKLLLRYEKNAEEYYDVFGR